MSSPRIPKPVPTKSKYWLTREGLLKRAEMLGSYTVWRSYNLYIQAGARALGASGYIYTLHPELSKTGPCPLCTPFGGRFYRVGMFTPYVPRHYRCVCSLDPVFDEEVIP